MPRPARLFLLFLFAFVFLSPSIWGEEEGNLTPPDDWPEKTRELYDRAKTAYDKAISARSDSEEKLESAISLFRRLRIRERRNPIPCYYLGILYQYTKEYDKARRILKKAVRLDSEFYEAWVELADTFVWLRDYEDSLPNYEKALEIKADYVTAYERRCVAYLRMGRFVDGLRDVEIAIKLTKDEKKKKSLESFRDKIDRVIKGPDWDKTYVAETENYIVKTGVSQRFAEFVAEQAELINKLYSSLFPSIKKADRKFPIVVYRDKAEYHENGGPKMAGGHYSPVFRQLELFKYPRRADTLIVLYHEGFHQFLHDYLENAPQWFNEGLADYFGPSKHVNAGRSNEGMKIRVNPWRLKTIQRAVRSRRCPSLRDLLHMSQAEMYNPKMARIHYAQAWSFIYFLCEYDGRKYFPLLKAYFEALRDGEGRAEAYEASFGRVDMEKIERLWRDFVLKLKQ